MFCGESGAVELKADLSMMSELVDWIGTDFKIIKKTENSLTIRVNCNYSAMKF